MKKTNKFIFFASLVALLTISCQDNYNSNENLPAEKINKVINDVKVVPNQYIIFFKESEIPSANKLLGKRNFKSRKVKTRVVDDISKNSIIKINTILSEKNIDSSKVLNYYTANISGISIKLTKEEFHKISKDKNVAYVELDKIVQFPEAEIENTVTSTEAQRSLQKVPCGITNAGNFVQAPAGQNWIWIIDTGIDLNHPDLNVIKKKKYAKSFASGSDSPDDCNGHGTTVAGVAAAINNSIGVVGISAGAPVVPIKVFRGCTSSGLNSEIIAGIDHVGKYSLSGDVLNVSLGYFHKRKKTCPDRNSFATSLLNVAKRGTFVIMAAGNNRKDVSRFAPSCMNGDKLITVASMECNRTFSNSFSNYGTDVIDFIAVGNQVETTYKDGGYVRIYGTSFAAPIISGIIHSKRGELPNTSGYVTRGSEKYPIAVR